MSSFNQNIYEIADVDPKIIDFSNFCVKIAAKSQRYHGCSLTVFIKKFTNYLNNKESLEDKRSFFIKHYLDNECIVKHLICLHEKKESLFLCNIF